MLRRYVKIILFLSSYIPLFLIIIIRNYENLYLIMFFGSLIVASSILLILTIRQAGRVSGIYMKIDRIENLNMASLAYLGSYVIPFLATELLEIRDVLSFGVLLGIIAVIYVRSDLIYLNPMLNILGFNLYKVYSEGSSVVMITKKRIKHADTEIVLPLAENVYLGRNP